MYLTLNKENDEDDQNEIIHDYIFEYRDLTINRDLEQNKLIIDKSIKLTQKINKKLNKISQEDVKPPFTYTIPYILENNINDTKDIVIDELEKNPKWEEFFERKIGNFFWSVVEHVTGKDRFDELISELSHDQEIKVREYFYSIGWNFVLFYDEEQNVLEFMFHEIVPDEIESI